MMKKQQIFTVLLLFIFPSVSVFSQVLKPARWTYETSKAGDEIAIFFKVELDSGWYIYSPDQDPDLGPIPTSVNFEVKGYELMGKPEPFGVHTKYDTVWEGNIRIIEKSGGGFIQKIKVLQPDPVIRGKVVYTVCSEKTGQCFFPEEDFEITLNRKKK